MRKKRVVKAWMLMIDEVIIGDSYWGYDIYPRKEDAVACRMANGLEKEWRVVPCTITYSIPVKGGRK
jgi:hypothetical protein